jgi:hypothetical protein
MAAPFRFVQNKRQNSRKRALEGTGKHEAPHHPFPYFQSQQAKGMQWSLCTTALLRVRFSDTSIVAGGGDLQILAAPISISSRLFGQSEGSSFNMALGHISVLKPAEPSP